MTPLQAPATLSRSPRNAFVAIRYRHAGGTIIGRVNGRTLKGRYYQLTWRYVQLTNGYKPMPSDASKWFLEAAHQVKPGPEGQRAKVRVRVQRAR